MPLIFGLFYGYNKHKSCCVLVFLLASSKLVTPSVMSVLQSTIFAHLKLKLQPEVDLKKKKLVCFGF